jgi:peptidoglycan/LPS O-acetylase OafA/YrhL
MGTWEIAEGIALVVFISIVPFAWASYRLIEEPFLELRTRYGVPTPPALAFHASVTGGVS